METATTRALALAAKAEGVESDYRLAQLLSVPRSTISNYRVGRSQLDETMVVKVAKMAGISAHGLLAEIAAERSKTPEARRAWLDLAKMAATLRPAAVVTLVILAASLAYDPPAPTADAYDVSALSVSTLRDLTPYSMRP